MKSRRPWVVGSIIVGMLAIGGMLAVTLVALWPRSATVGIQIDGWTLPVRGTINFSDEDVPSGLRFLFPWQEGEEVFITAGTVKEVSENRLVVTLYDESGDQEFALSENVRVYRGVMRVSAAELREDETIVVFSVDKKVEIVLVGPMLRLKTVQRVAAHSDYRAVAPLLRTFSPPPGLTKRTGGTG